MEPYNYSLPQTAQQPDAFGQGFAQGQALKQQEQQQAQQQQMQADLMQLSHSPTVANISTVMARYPQFSEKFKPLLDNATEQQRQNRIGQASDVYAALLAGRTDIAKTLLQEHADAARNAGDEQNAKSAEVMAQILDKGDAGRNMVLSSAGMFLAAAMGSDKFADVYGKLGSEVRDNELHPSKLAEAQANAQYAGKPKPMTVLAKLNQELAQGLITRDQFDAAVKKETTHAPGTQVNVNTRQEGEEARTVGKGFGETYIQLQKNGFEAQGKLSRYTRMSQLLDGVNTGKLTPTKTQIAALADGFGVTLDPKLGEKQAMEALSNEIALSLRNPSGGAGMPGAMSDKDREFLTGMTPGLAKTPEGNRLIIDTAQKLAQRDIDVARIAREYRKKHGTLDEGFYDDLAAFSDAHPMFGGGQKPSPSVITGPTATGPNGEKVMWNGTSWVPVK